MGEHVDDSWLPDEARVTIEVAVTAERVREAVEAWAVDSGWVRAEKMRPLMVYVSDISGLLSGFFSAVFGGLEMSAAISEQDRCTRAEFVASMTNRIPGIQTELGRAAATFARGVSSYLDQPGARDVVANARAANAKRSRRGAIMRLFKLLQAAFLVILVPATVLVYALNPAGLLAGLVLFWIATFMMTGGLIRYRIFGMRVQFFAVVVYAMWALAVLLTVLESAM